MPGQHRREGRHLDETEHRIEVLAWLRILIEFILQLLKWI